MAATPVGMPGDPGTTGSCSLLGQPASHADATTPKRPQATPKTQIHLGALLFMGNTTDSVAGAWALGSALGLIPGRGASFSQALRGSSARTGVRSGSRWGT